uniref:Uncharacterized protein n=1 Tax=Parastrongyloides trichosuri TaxID=131310 RepID=A0A0N4ZLR4_PARTI
MLKSFLFIILTSNALQGAIITAKKCYGGNYAFAIMGQFVCPCGDLTKEKFLLSKCGPLGFNCHTVGTIPTRNGLFNFNATMENMPIDEFQLKLRFEYECCCDIKARALCIRELFLDIPYENIHCGTSISNVKYSLWNIYI